MSENGPAALEAAVLRALEEAGLAGLCLEGRIEVAAAEVRRLRPDWPAEDALALVREVAGIR
jgi:hypothetical protein